MDCLKCLNNSKLYAIAGSKPYQSLVVTYKRENKLSEKSIAHGNMVSMPHLSRMKWDFADRLKLVTNSTFTSYYNYDSSDEHI